MKRVVQIGLCRIKTSVREQETFTSHVGHPVPCCVAVMLTILELVGKVKWLTNKV
jgi:hypothetical protein